MSQDHELVRGLSVREMSVHAIPELSRQVAVLAMMVWVHIIPTASMGPSTSFSSEAAAGCLHVRAACPHACDPCFPTTLRSQAWQLACVLEEIDLLYVSCCPAAYFMSLATPCRIQVHIHLTTPCTIAARHSISVE